MTGTYAGDGSPCPAASPLRTGPLRRLRQSATRVRRGPPREDLAVRPHARHGADRRHPQGDRLPRRHHHYLLEIAPGVEITVLEQNLHSARTEERWADGERVRVGWLPEHSLAPLI